MLKVLFSIVFSSGISSSSDLLYQDPHAEEKALWVQAKRAVLAILRVQPARDLVECLMSPVSEEHEMFWEDIVDRELMNDNLRQRRRRMPSTTGAESAYRLDDIRSYVFHAFYRLFRLVDSLGLKG